MPSELSSRPHGSPRRRQVLRILMVSAVGVCGLLIATLIALHTPPARRIVASQVTKLLAAEQITLETDELHYNLFNLSLAARNVTIRSAGAPKAPAFATIENARLNLTLLPLLRGRYVVRSSRIDGLSVHYFVDSKGRDNLPRPPKDPNDPGEPLDYLIADLTVAKAQVRYEDRAQQIDFVQPLSSIVVNGHSLTDRHDIRFEAAQGGLRVRDRSIVVDRINGELDLGNDDLTIAHLNVEAEGSHVRLTGSIRDFDEAQADLKLQGRLDAARAAPLTGLNDAIGGTLDLAASATGPIASPAIEARVTASDLQFRNIGDVQLAAVARYDVAARRADVTSMNATAPWGSVSGDLTLALGGAGASRLNAEVRSVDAATLMRALQLPYAVATSVDARIQAEWPGLEYRRASGAVTATLIPTTSRVQRSVLPVGGRLDVRGRNGRIVARLHDVHSAGARINGQVLVTDHTLLEGAVQVRVGNLGDAIASTETFLGKPRGSLLPTRVGGAVAVNARVGGTIEAPTTTANIHADSLAVGNAKDIALAGAFAYTPAALTIDHLDLTWQESHTRLDGRVGLKGGRHLDLAVSAESLDVPTLVRAFNLTNVPASGTIMAQGTVLGTVTHPTANIVVQGSNLVMYGEVFGWLSVDINFADREIVLTHLLVDKPQPARNGQLSATGRYHLDQRSYTFDLQSENLRLLNLTLSDGQQLRGDVQLAGRGTGTVEAPAGTVKLTIDALAVEQANGSTEGTSAYDLGRVAIDVVAANQQATITASAPRFNLDANGTIGLVRPWPATVKLQAENLNLTALPLQLETTLEGQLNATVDAAGNLTELTHGEATATIEALAGRWNRRPFAVSGPAVVRYADERLHIDRLQLTASDSSLIVRGVLPMTARAGEGALDIDAQANLATLWQYAPVGTNVTGDGALTLTGTIRGTLERIDPDLVISVEDGLILSPEIEPGLSNLRLRARVADGVADLEQLTGTWGTARLEASGQVPLEILPELPIDIPRKGGPATFKASVADLNPAAIPGAPTGLGGRIGVDAQVAASRADLAALEGRITFPQLEIVLNALTLAQQQPSAVSIAAGTAQIEQFNLSGSVGTLAASGTIGLLGQRPLDLTVDGQLNVAAVSTFTDVVRAEGDTTLRLAAHGTIATPELTGTIDLADATVVSDEPNIAAENVSAHINLEGTRISLTSLTADINGGTLEGSGTMTVGTGAVTDLDLQLSTDDFAFDAPLNLRSLSDAKIQLTRRGDEFVIGGQVTIDEAGLTGDINFDTGLLATMTSRRELELTEERNPLLERVLFNIDVDTAMPILIDNNLARAEVTADVRVTGTPYDTGLTGRLTLLEGAEVTLNERRYEVERGVITFVDERRISPSVDLELNTTAGNYDITIIVEGTADETETTLTADPVLPEPDIMALLVTGRTLDEMRGEEFEIAREQVLSYLTGRAGSRLGRGLERATGLSEVRVEPQLIANEADPSARLTVGQELSDELKLVYSTNLTDSNDQIWVAEYDVTRRFQTRAVRQSDNSYRVDFRHDVRIGGVPSPRRQPRHRPVVTSVSITPTTAAEDSELRRLFGVETGDAYDFFAVRKGVQRIEEYCRERGFLQARVRVQRQVDEQSARLTLNIATGPLVELRFEGATPPSKVLDDVRTHWHRGVFDKQRADDGLDTLRAWLMDDDHLQPKLDYRIDDVTGDQRLVMFRIEPGPRFQKVMLAFEGASGIDPNELDDIIEEQRLERQLFTDPIVVTALLQRYYREQGYLAAELDKPTYEFEGSLARVVLAIREGPRFTVRSVSTAGNRVFTTPTLVGELPVVAADPFLPAAAERSLERIRDLYWSRGYNDVRSDYEMVLDRVAGTVDVAFTIEEGPQSVIADITIDGNQKTSEHLVREQIELSPSQPLDLSALSRSRRNLYDTGAFSVVDVTREDLEGDVPSPPSTQPQEDSTVDHKPVRLNVNVREVQPIQLRYGASYDTERGLGGIFDISNHNSLGKARVVGLASRYDAQLREGRVYITQPSLRYWPVQTMGSMYYRRERNPATELTDAFDIDRKGLTIQQEVEFADSYVWSYGYRYERARTFQPTPAGLIAQTLTVSPLTSTLTREARDEVLDASTGSFTSHAFAYSPGWLGSDLPFLKYYGQYFRYFPLQAPQRKPFTNEILRPRLVYATGIRLGLAHGLGGEVPASERFYAGGSTTLRGFAQNAVGPIGFNRVPTGGNVLLVLNNELRFPLVSIVDGVVFADVGNVFPKVSDFTFTDLRESAGVGIRLRTRWFLLRGDYGLALDHRPGERRSRFYFSIGQAF